MTPSTILYMISFLVGTIVNIAVFVYNIKLKTQNTETTAFFKQELHRMEAQLMAKFHELQLQLADKHIEFMQEQTQSSQRLSKDLQDLFVQQKESIVIHHERERQITDLIRRIEWLESKFKERIA